MFPFKCALVPEIPNNEALFRPISVVAPEGSILNARFPAPVKTRAKTTNNLNQVIFGAHVAGRSASARRRAAARSGRSRCAATRRRYGRFVVDMLPHGGRGATTELDGMIPVAFPHNSVVTPVEIMETKAPVAVSAEGAASRLGGRRAAARRARADDRLPARRPRGHRAQHHPGQDRDVSTRARGRRARRARRGAAERRGAGALPARSASGPATSSSSSCPAAPGSATRPSASADRELEDDRMGYVPAAEPADLAGGPAAVDREHARRSRRTTPARAGRRRGPRPRPACRAGRAGCRGRRAPAGWPARSSGRTSACRSGPGRRR